MTDAWKRRALVLEAMACVAVASLALRIVPVRALLRPGRPLASGGAAQRDAPRIAEAMRSAARRAPRLGRCLAQALALRKMLARRGVASEIHLSVGRSEADALGGHAWLTVGDAVLYGGGPARGQVPIFSSGAASRSAST